MIDAAMLKRLIADEIQTLTDPRVSENISKYLCEPQIELFDWSYGPPDQYPCWIVLKDDLGNSDIAIVYCEQGFGPDHPWGLVWLTPENGRRDMGMDTDWFPSFLDAYWDSFAPTALPIWRVFKLYSDEPLSGEMAWSEARKLQKDLQNHDEASRYYVRHKAFIE